jgi:phosphonate transport system substrate-binding protein
MHSRGLDPEVFFRKSFFTYAHRDVIRAVAAGLAQSGSVDGYVWEVLQDSEPDLVSRTRPMRKSEFLGFPPIATSEALAGSGTIAALSQALRKMADDPLGREVLAMLRLDGFGEPDDSVFDGIAAKVAMLRGVL